MVKVSVIIPSYNHAQFVKEAINSVLNQTYQDFEIIITDDGSSDNSIEIINTFTDERIKRFYFAENQGACIVVNYAIEQAQGEFIALLNSDDIWLPHKLETQVKFLDENSDIGAVFSYAQIIDEDRNKLEKEHFYKQIFIQPNRNRFEWLNHFFFNGNCLCHPSILIRKECYEKVGLYDPRYRQLPDFDMWIRLCMKFEIYIIPENLVQFRLLDNEANVSSNKRDSQYRSVLEYRNILKNYLNNQFINIFTKVFEPQLTSKFFLKEELFKVYICYLSLCYGKLTSVHQPFAIAELYKILNNKTTVELLQTYHHFTYNDFFQLAVGKYDFNKFINTKTKNKTIINSLSVIVPWWDHTEFLELWENNLNYLSRCQIIFIDNGSKEEGKIALENFCKTHTINLIRNEENGGFAAANNQGLAIATGDYILHLNNDLFIKELDVQYICKLAGEGIAGPGYAKNELGIPYVEGWGLCVKKSLLNELGGWNEIYGPGYWDDVDLNYRAKLAGYPITPIPEMSQWIEHITNATGRDGRINQIALHIANRGKFIKQYFDIHPKIIIDGVFFQLYKTGIARVWKSLLEQWANTDFANHILVLDRANSAPHLSGIRYRQIPAYDYNNTEADRQMLQQICDEEGAELFISSYYTTPINTPSVFMAYDMIPEILGGDLNQPMWREKHQAINHASGFIAISENTAKDINKFFPDIPTEAITVAHCGVAQLFSPASQTEIQQFKHKYGINKPYFLLGGLGGYKNSILFFQAFSQLANKTGFDVVATGANPQLPSEWRQFTAGCTFHGLQLTDEELRLAYSGAVALVYPSKYEGFGMPVIEAMACGCPVITTPNGSLSEAGGEAVIYVKDDDIEGMANALCDVQKPTLRRNLIQAGLQQAQKFSWVTMAEIVKEALFNTISPQIKLTETNYLIFPDWQSEEEELSEELYYLITNLATNPPLPLGEGLGVRATGDGIITLVIDTTGITEEDANLILSGIAMNLMLEEELDLENSLDFALISNLNQQQWSSLLTQITAKVNLTNENQTIINALEIDDLITIEGSGNNYVIFPDWSADQEQLAEEIGQVLANLAEEENCTLLVNLDNIDQEEVGLFFSEIAMNLMLVEGIELPDTVQISFVNFNESQWTSLEGLIKEQISMNSENIPDNLFTKS